MNAKPLPSLDGALRLSLDIREANVEVPRLLELEHALEPRHPQRPKGSPKRSMQRVDVYKAVRSAGEFCTATVPELAQLAKCSVRTCQYALADLFYLGWLKKLTDVGALGGLVGTGAQKQGNVLAVSRPSWAWDGTHRKRLWSLATSAGVRVHSMHPLVQEALGLLERQEVIARKAIPGAGSGTGAQHAPLGRVHRAKSPLSLIDRGSRTKREGKRPQGKKVEWPKTGQGFLEAWKQKYKRGPFPDQKALDAYHEIKLGAGGAKEAEEVAKLYIATQDGWLAERGHPLGWLRKHWPSVLKAKPAPAEPRKAVKVAGGDVLTRLANR